MVGYLKMVCGNTVPSNGRKFAIVHNGIVEHFSKNFECAMIYIKKGIQRRRKMHDQNSIDGVETLHKSISERWICLLNQY